MPSICKPGVYCKVEERLGFWLGQKIEKIRLTATQLSYVQNVILENHSHKISSDLVLYSHCRSHTCSKKNKKTKTTKSGSSFLCIHILDPHHSLSLTNLILLPKINDFRKKTK